MKWNVIYSTISEIFQVWKNTVINQISNWAEITGHHTNIYLTDTNAINDDWPHDQLKLVEYIRPLWSPIQAQTSEDDV